MYRNNPTINVRIPQIIDLATAVRIYYNRIELSNKDIQELFGSISSNTISKLKQLAVERMEEYDVPSWNAKYVNTESAYKAWGLDIQSLERRLERLRKLGMDKEAVS